MHKFLLTASLALAFCGTLAADNADRHTYRNPVVNYSLPDPSVIKADDGYFYLYATEDIRNLPILRSSNLVDWTQVGTAFTKETRPDFEPKGGLWAPDIRKIGDKYVLYYSMSRWGGEWTCGIGVATADKPQGPFTDHGMMFRSNGIGVQNSIDPCIAEDTDGRKYMFWGSFRGIYAVELTDDGLAVKAGAKPRQVAGTAYEGTYIYQRGGYYYMFASIGSCCEGLKSTYTTVVGRSKNLFGPYVDRKGQSMMDNHHEVLIHKNGQFVGTGHNAGLMTDDEGNDWILYHAFRASDPDKGRILLLDKVTWTEDGWPAVAGQEPAAEAPAPVFRNQGKDIAYADPTIMAADGTYYLTGTHENDGFSVLQSDDLLHWHTPDDGGKAEFLLRKGQDVFGTKGFWAPQWFNAGEDGWYLAYTANEQTALAKGSSVEGPFTQDKASPIDPSAKNIDPFIFRDDDGTCYLYHVRFNKGNYIWVAQIDLATGKLDAGTLTQCLQCTEPWERTGDYPSDPIMEGPTVVKIDGWYYLFYSANHFMSKDYAVGYAVARSPMGPWTKYEGNPIIHRSIVGENGSGHGDLFQLWDGQLAYVYHVHHSDTQVSPRLTRIVPLKLTPNAKGYYNVKADVSRIIRPTVMSK